MDEVWAIVLAAGSSTRMKTQKLLLPLDGRTMIESVIEQIIASGIKNIMVVLGSEKEEIERIIGKLSVNLCFNNKFSDGMLSSVICGFSSIPRKTSAVLVFLGDQPHISAEVIRGVVKAWQTSRKGIVIPVFDGRRGHPILIDTKYRKEIDKLDPEKGLRSLAHHYSTDVYELDCDFSAILNDLDTPEDYLRLINQIN